MKKNGNHITIGVYSNDSYKRNIVRPEDLERHIEYNKVMRFGRALFVDGKCVYSGYLNEEKIKEWTEKTSQMKMYNNPFIRKEVSS
jgi:hypothetical protein